jgi:N-acetylglucosaminyl-diphospho-decaprenol L-rhamnosyltransferase
MDLSIIMVNWNSKDFLANAIRRIEASIRNLRYEVVVIDSGSFDGCADMLRRSHPQVRFIQSALNIGFAAANNCAFRATSGKALLFLNPDTEVLGSAIRQLYEALNALPDAGIVGPKLLNSDGSVQNTCVRAFPTLVNQLLDSDFLRTRFPRSALWGTLPLSSSSQSPQRVDAVSGASLMMRRTLFEEVGMFSTDYFMYAEDLDLCLKCGRRGARVYYVPSAVVVHHGGGSSGHASASTFSAVMSVESQWRYFRKTRSPAYAHAYRAVMLFASLLRIALLMLAWPAQLICRRSDMQRHAVRKWRARLRWAFGVERWVRDY